MVSDGTQIECFLDNVSKGKRTITPSWTINDFGGMVDGLGYNVGYMDEIMIFDDALSAAGVSELWNGGVGVEYPWADEELFVIDRATGLYWAADANNSGWVTGSYPNGWSETISNAAGLTFAGYSDWRVANIKELISVIDYGLDPPGFPADVFLNAVDAEPWSSTTYLTDDTQAFYILGGLVTTEMKMYPLKTPAVRGGL